MARMFARANLVTAIVLCASACTGRVSGGTAITDPGSGTGIGSTVGGAGSGGFGTGTAGAAVVPLGTDPGRVTIHRLNRAEYNNTVRDLLGTTARPADVFPVDDRGLGF